MNIYELETIWTLNVYSFKGKPSKNRGTENTKVGKPTGRTLSKGCSSKHSKTWQKFEAQATESNGI